MNSISKQDQINELKNRIGQLKKKVLILENRLRKKTRQKMRAKNIVYVDREQIDRYTTIDTVFM